jgi:2-desacetyl-2-hydroxyethyl bacteriochlorophyllide A dehydrogenase
MKTRCLLFTSPGQVRIADTAVPAPQADEILVETRYSCVSPGTELRCLAGQQSGAPPFPFIPGYALSGVVKEAGIKAPFKAGEAVFATGTKHSDHACCWGGHCGHAVLPGRNAIRIPDGVDLRAAAAAKLAAIAYHGLRLTRPLPHEHVAVVGLGPIGRFSALLHALSGAQVVAADLSARRRESVECDGITTLSPENGLADAFSTVFPNGADIVVDATGAPSVLAQTAAVARDLPWDNLNHTPARLLLQGSYAGMPPFPYDTAFMRELHVLVPRDCQRRDLEAVLDLMARRLLKPETFLESVDSIEEAPSVYERLRTRPDSLVTATFSWSQ